MKPFDWENNPKDQAHLIREGQRTFPGKQLAKQPTVVFDRGGLDEFWTGLMNSEQRESLLKRIKSGELVPVNADVLGDVANVQTVFHTWISEPSNDIPTIPTIVNVTGLPVSIGTHRLPREMPGIFVRKQSFTENGISTAHRARGVSVVQVTNENSSALLPKHRGEFLQPFVVPPDPDLHVRDVRTYFVDGKPVEGSVRRARKPLTADNLSGRNVPNEDQYPSAKAPGPNEPLEGPLRERVFNIAKDVTGVLDRKVRGRQRAFSPYSTVGFGSVDFLLDANGIPRPVDYDISPSVTTFQDIDRSVASHVAQHLASLADRDGGKRNIMVIGHNDDRFTSTIIEKLKQMVLPDRVILQKPLLDQLQK